MKAFMVQFIKFIGISGVGWCLDFSLYSVFTFVFGWEVFVSNCLSSIPAVTLVFFVSTRKIFREHQGKLPVCGKYLVYVAYQILLLLAVSSLGQLLSVRIGLALARIHVVRDFSKVIAKILITPVTMVLNFFVMKFLTEKI